MTLELLANELLLDLFDYLSTVHLLRAFYNLNNRFNTLIFLHFQTHTLTFRAISKQNFDLICQVYLPSLTKRISSLQLSDDDDTPQQIDRFFSYGFSFCQFTRLKSLSINRLYSFDSMKKIIEELRYLPDLTHLKITRHTITYNEIYDIGIIDLIGWLAKLTCCQLDIINDSDNCSHTVSIISSKLKYLCLPYLECNRIQLIDLIKHISNLHSLTIRITDHSSISQLSSIRFLSIKKLYLTFSGSLNTMNNLLQPMINLQELKLETQSIYIDGYQWQTIMETYLPYLIKFQLKMSISISDHKHKDEKIDIILNSFRSQFWIAKHQWFVECNWIPNETSTLVHVYTLPYAFENLFFMGNVRSKSTCLHDHHAYSFDCVHNLYYGYIPYQNLPTSKINLSQIRYLDLTIPFDQSFWSMVPTLDRLDSLNVVLCNDMNPTDIQLSLQRLLDRALHLRSLRFFSWCVQLDLPLKIQHSSIRRVNLQGPNIVYNHEQCLEFCQSVIGQHCQVLFINVKQRTDIVDLVNNMKNLRALIVQCTEMVSTPKEDEPLIDWLQQRLSRTCSISNSLESSSNIRLWIR